MDGAQAFSLTMCSKRVRLADATWRRMSYVPSAIRNARGQNETRLVWTHPAKSLAPTQARAVSSQYVGSLDHTLRLARSTVPRCWVPRRLSYACDLPAYLPTCLPTYLPQARAVWRALAERPYLPPPLHTYVLSTEASQSGGGEIRLRATETITTVNPT